MAFSQADLEHSFSKTKLQDMPSFEESNNVSDDVRGKIIKHTHWINAD